MSELTARWHSVFVTAAWRLVTMSTVGEQHHKAQADSKKEHGSGQVNTTIKRVWCPSRAIRKVGDKIIVLTL